MDERFELVKRDHRFRPIRQSQRKIQIDKRFHGIFFKKKFRVNMVVDKRGRPIKESMSENLKKFYHLSKEERKRIHKERLKDRERLQKRLRGQGGGSDAKFEDLETENGCTNNQSQAIHVTNDGESSDSSYFSSEDDSDIDLARGKGNLESSSDEEDDAEFQINNGPDHGWGEMDNEAPRSEVTSDRLALCSMDWDRVTAADIFVLLDSFKPTGGAIKSVAIYPSKFGAERMGKEARLGPAELKEMKSDEHEDEWTRDEDQDFNMEKLREYQLNRLKYYYAVIVCDSANTSEKIYNECDGIEFETSCSKLDLRFIPSEMEFNEYPPKEEVTAMPDLMTYKPASFITTALNQTKVALTWDETDHKRISLTKNKFTKDQLENMDVKDFLASGSESGDESDDVDLETSDSQERFERKSKMDEQEKLEMYKSLLLGGIIDDDKEKDDDVDVEITWEPDLKLKVEQDVAETKPKKLKKNETKSKTDSQVEEAGEAELEMIMLGEGERAKSGEEFQIDVNDERFSALYKSSKYALDRSDSAFRKSEGMEKFLQERHSRLNNIEENELVQPEQDIKKTEENDSVSRLVKSVKKKSAWLGKKRNK